MRFALAALVLYAAYRWLSRRPDSDVVSNDCIARYEATLRKGEPLPEVDEQELQRIRRAWETRRGSKGKIRPFYRPTTRHWKVS